MNLDTKSIQYADTRLGRVREHSESLSCSTRENIGKKEQNLLMGMGRFTI